MTTVCRTATLLVAGLAPAFLTTGATGSPLGTYQFQLNSTSVTSPAAGLNFGQFTRANGPVALANGNQFDSYGWSTGGSLNTATTSYVGFTATVQAGYAVTLDKLVYDIQRFNGSGSNRGPQSAEVRYSLNGFAASVGSGSFTTPTSATTAQPFDFANASAAAGQTADFRVYGWNAAGGAGNTANRLVLDNVVLHGETQALASLTAAVSSSAPSRVIVNATNIRHTVNVSNSALAAGTVATQGLDYSLALSGSPVGLSLASPSSGTGLGTGGGTNHFVDVATSSAGTKSGSVTASSTNAWRANGTVGASSAAFSLANVDVLDRSNAEFSNVAGSAAASTGSNSLTLDFGTVAQGAGGGSLSATFDLLNAIANTTLGAAYTAGLDLDQLLNPTASAAFGLTGDSTFTAIGAGAANAKAYSVSFDTDALGVFSATYEFKLSDENLAGASSAGSETLTLNILGNVIPVPEPASAGLLAAGLLLIARRRTR